MTPVRRYIQAFFKALAMTLRGETISPPPLRHPDLHEWAQSTVDRVEQISAAADAAGLAEAERASVKLRIDKRDVSLEAVLQAIRHHAAQEYPYLLKHYNQYSLMTLQATNLNDQYLAQAFAAVDTLPQTVQGLLSQLHEHLQAIPPSRESN